MNILIRRLVGLAVLAVLVLLGYAVTLPGQDVMPVEKRQWFDDNGVPLAGGLIYTYSAGTSTSATVYTDSALTTAHANPVVLDSAGRATIYLGAASYRFIVANSAAVQLYTQDNIRSLSQAAAGATLNDVCNGRITLTSGTPVETTDVTAATTIYFTPYKGNRCIVYDGSAWVQRTFSELSLTLGSDAAATNYDLFAYDNSGSLAIQRRAWSSNTARATDLTLQDGVSVRIGATTARYLGTYRTTNVAGQVENTTANRYVYNWLNPVTWPVRRQDYTASWNYTLTPFRQANANTLNAIGIVNGQAGGMLHLTILGNYSNNGASGQGEVSIASGLSTVPVTGCPVAFANGPSANIQVSLTAVCSLTAAVGYSTFMWIERSPNASGTNTWYGLQASTSTFSGLFGSWSER